ncbi:polymerase III polypeptide H [Epithele typhae]|uniref:polymerase III polypeptide H n=1 Tax=Epithele typhae TaxID=378194 RepID=UPI002008811D|nr:polymerase III polypeptide H [Epithele typhae]KAH9912400.1 polymerase III polypeptide H [Epithele typhae]
MSNVNPTGRSRRASGTVCLPPEQAITNQLNEVHARRVLHGVGLYICVFDLAARVAEGKVRYGDGWMWYQDRYDYLLCVFRPFGTEAILAKIKSSDEDGVRRPHCRIFDDIYVPLVCLPEPCASDPKERPHFWLPGSETTSSHEPLGSPLADRIYIDAGYVLRVRVEADGFHDDEPGPPEAHEGIQRAHEVRRSPYTTTVSAFAASPCRRKTAYVRFWFQCPMSEQRFDQWRNAGVETTDDG